MNVESMSHSGPSYSFREFLRRLVNNEALLGILFVLPSFIGFCIFYAYPAGRSVYISLLDWNLLTPAKYVGLENYQNLYHDERFWDSLWITLKYVLWNIPLQTALAIMLAVLIERSRNSSILRAIIILPWLVPGVVVALLWLWMLDPSLGIVDSFLKGIGLSRQPFLGSPKQAIQAIAGINIWRFTGYTAILFFAGLKGIPKSLYEAAAIDGAGAFRQFRSITLPLLRPVTVFVLVTSVIGSFQVFDVVAVTNGGGPAGSTRVVLYYIYEQIFARRIRMGAATAASVVLFLILVGVTLLQMRFLRAGQSDLADYS